MKKFVKGNEIYYTTDARSFRTYLVHVHIKRMKTNRYVYI